MTKKTYNIEGMDCASCAIMIEKALNKTPGIKKAVVNLMTEKAIIETDKEVPVTQLQKAVASAGNYKLINPANAGSVEMQGHDHSKMLKETQLKTLKNKMFFGLVFSVLLMILGLAKFSPFLKDISNQTIFAFSLILATPVQIWLGSQFYKGMWGSLKNFKANMDTLIAVGTSAAYFYSLTATLFPAFFSSAGQEAVIYFDTSTVILTLIILADI